MEYLDLKSNKERIIIDFSTFNFKNLLLLGHYSYNKAKKSLPKHKHTNMLEICYLETGYQHYQIGDQNFTLKGGDLLITPPNVEHGTSDYPEEKGSLFWMIIKLPKEPFSLLNLSVKESEFITHKIINLPSLHFEGSLRIKKYLSEIFSIYNKKRNVLSKIEIKNQVLNFLLEVIECGERSNPKILANDIDFICNYVEDNLNQKLNIHDLANKINLSESRFKHKFKLEVGVPPNEYIIKAKINKSKELLKKEDISIADLAYDLGFSTSSYFSTVFKKHQGISPSKYKLKQVSELKETTSFGQNRMLH